ncbi:MAG: transcription-repair coupling factor, partial [Clostridia bacterium]|nr:transcription-repair coupling factor [Clostridia bacterium]
MNTIFERSLSSLSAFKGTCGDIAAGRTPAMLTGLGHIHKALWIHSLCRSLNRRAVVLTGDEAEASRLSEELSAMGTEALLLPARDLALRRVESASHEYEQLRLATLTRMAQGNYTCVIASAEAAAQFTLPAGLLLRRSLKLTRGQRLPVADLPAALSAAGYERCDQIEGPGQFAVRGGITDVYPAACPAPLRIELWGDEIDTLTYFDLLSQRRTDTVEEIDIAPAAEILCDDPTALAERIEALADSLKGKSVNAKETLLADARKLRTGVSIATLDKYIPLLYDTPATLLDYAPEALVLASELSKIKERIRTSQWQLNEDVEQLLEEGQLCRGLDRYTASWEDLLVMLEKRDTVLMESFARSTPDLPLRNLYHIDARSLPVWSGGLDILADDLRDMLARGFACIVLAGREEKNAETLAADLQKLELPALYAPSPQAPLKKKVLVIRGGLSSGFELPEAGVAVITHGRLNSGSGRIRRRQKRNKGAEIHSLSELSVGDYIVHASHGIAIYQGVHQINAQGVIKDYLKLQYDKGDVLYVPVTQLDLVSKYVGSKEDVTVKVHRLGGQEWQKTKTRIRTAVKDIARQLIALYSKRMSAPGYAFEPDTEWQYDFERHFEYEETEDQLRCIDEIKSDMERPIPMDRLL